MKDLIAPIAFWELSEEEIKRMSNGCGTNRFSVPNHLFGLVIKLAWDIHDFM